MSERTGFVLAFEGPIAEAKLRVAHGGGMCTRCDGAWAPCADGFVRPPKPVDRLELAIEDAKLERGAFATRITVCRADARNGVPQSFTFFLRDVTSAAPIFVPALGVAVLPAGDARTFAHIARDVRERGLTSVRDTIESEPEETYENACAFTRDMSCPIWLGVGRDVRIFRVTTHSWGGGSLTGCWGQIEPWNHSVARDAPEHPRPIQYLFTIGRGVSCSFESTRRLEDGALPILRSLQRDDDVGYDVTAFATLETRPLGADGACVRGTHPIAAYANTGGHMLTEAERQLYDRLHDTEIRGREQELVCWFRAVATNAGHVPRYAYFKAPTAGGSVCDPAPAQASPSDPGAGEVIAVALLDGRPMPQPEMAVLLEPGESIAFDLLLPHKPVTRDRAVKLAAQSFADHHVGCRAYWQAKLGAGASISVPEEAVDERVRAGLLHLDIATLGLTESGPLLATVGWYSPIGSESAPIIQFYDSMGWHDVAERCIDFFLDRQRDDGFIQTFGGYQLETGPALWTVGEHFRYTRDHAWARRVRDRVLRSCDYIVQWRCRNLREELRGRGYGLLDGKVADPEDFFHSFMLNGLAYVGLKRVAEMYADIDPPASKSLAQECAAYLKDIRTAYLDSVADSPVVALGDGTWVPSFAPWAEYPGPVSLYAEGGVWFSHGAFACRDTLIGSLYLVIGEVLDAREPAAEWLLRAHQELMTHRNAGLSQPYYCRHDWIQLKRGEVKQYLTTYYNQFASLQDRQTYTFWEHYFGVSPHKTHEEGWFLMQTRWMLWHEDFGSRTLHLLSMIPRMWMADGKSIELKNCVSPFGVFDLRVKSSLGEGRIEASITCDPARSPRRVEIRLPHPEGRKARSTSAGRYDAATESVLLDNFTGAAEVALVF